MGTPDDSPVHVAFDVGPLYGHRTGVGTAVDGMLGGLRQRRDVVVHPYLVSFRSAPESGHVKLPLPGIVASHLWARARRPMSDRWLGAAQVVHGTNYVVPPSRLPSVVSVYDCWFLAHPEQASPLVRRAGRALRRAVDAGAWVHTSSDATGHAARRLLGTDRVTTIHLGPPEPARPVGTERPTVAAPVAGRPVVLAIGTEERRKGLPLLVEAFGILAADEPDPVLVLVGARGDDSAAVDRTIDGLPSAIAQRVHRFGVVDDTTRDWLLRHAAVLAYPSLDEGFGFPVLEAQLAGTPVVATDVGSVAEIGGDAVVLVARRSPHEFADALSGVMSGGRLGRIEAGHRNVRRFSWETTADGLVELYRTVAESVR